VPGAVGLSVIVPLVACVPLQAPLAVQRVALVEVQLKSALAPDWMAVGLRLSVTVGTGAVTVTTAELDTLTLLASEQLSV
jgi:hypothetical protein